MIPPRPPQWHCRLLRPTPSRALRGHRLPQHRWSTDQPMRRLLPPPRRCPLQASRCRLWVRHFLLWGLPCPPLQHKWSRVLVSSHHPHQARRAPRNLRVLQGQASSLRPQPRPACPVLRPCRHFPALAPRLWSRLPFPVVCLRPSRAQAPRGPAHFQAHPALVPFRIRQSVNLPRLWVARPFLLFPPARRHARLFPVALSPFTMTADRIW